MESHRHDRHSHDTQAASESAALYRARGGVSSSRDSPLGSRNPRLRSEDSWIEVSSQPSTSSLSSAATTDDIITTGLRVERPDLRASQIRNKKKRSKQHARLLNDSSRESSIAGGSSQDEYDESDSESDKVMSGSNEDVTTHSRGDALLLRHGSMSENTSSGEDDEDDRSTALGPRISSSPFVPQPNAFSHAPQYSRSRSYNDPGTTPSLVSNSSQATTVRHNSSSTIRNTRRSSRTQHVPYNMISPSYQADHDAALRASLSTLLSLGTAVRGAPKNDSPPAPAGPQVAPASTFRLVPESVAMGEKTDDGGRAPVNPGSPRTETRTMQQPKQPRSISSSAPSKGKRKASKDRGSSHTSASKKSRQTSMSSSLVGVSPTLMTWVISAGVVVLFSAISFSAGYALGREVGRTEMAMDQMIGGSMSEQLGGVRSSTGCGRDAVKGSLKRLRWGGAAGGVSVYS
ncbi:conserved hypothetical protein [Talaromyces stipitatus ATCC 10500]|uniref:Uncharacterized protein n=1 Tax=Talaromyces stipitatus (strain ATCC 10500 / CBS 375.48 / QM 6759 / NRRL 1006) TaxID=441959 RepID=B8MSA9_TALSN|nr:uncharacterized protein TSTA_003050 [Talaromyces stipitatus ATCC 10500]EED12242.1 conserved hypothetical protein [Talaromyces stipitatus ATCC 10500]